MSVLTVSRMNTKPHMPTSDSTNSVSIGRRPPTRSTHAPNGIRKQRTGQLRCRDQQAESKTAEMHLFLEVFCGRPVKRNRGETDKKAPRPHGKPGGWAAGKPITSASFNANRVSRSAHFRLLRFSPPYVEPKRFIASLRQIKYYFRSPARYDEAGKQGPVASRVPCHSVRLRTAGKECCSRCAYARSGPQRA